MKKGLFLDEPIVAIDIGTTKICVLVAQRINTHMFEIIGIGKAPSYGLAKGVVVDINKTIEAIKKAVEEATIMSGVAIKRAIIGVSGSHIQTLNSHGMVPIKRRVVSQTDIDAVIASAQAVTVAQGKQILHAIAQYFCVDGERIQNPLGMHGVRLETEAHIILGSISSVQNLIECCNQAGVAVTDIVLEQIASGMSVLSEDERRLGVAVLDIGGGTSDFALYNQNALMHTAVIPVAGNHFTHDVALCLRTTMAQAECIKKEVGSVLLESVQAVSAEQASTHETPLMIESVEGNAMRAVSVHELNSILHCRAQELMHIVDMIIKKNQLRSLMSAGLVLTGGSSQLEGLVSLASDQLCMNVRLGKPSSNQPCAQTLNSPLYATVYGLLLYAYASGDTNSMSNSTASLIHKIGTRMKHWITDLF
ncbi:MAG: cell division protein FtsA [Candidatus Babeliales bacterium]